MSGAGALGIIMGYGIAVTEMLVMSGPFAAYFYGVYSPFLQLLQRSEPTMWLSELWLIHTLPHPLVGVFEAIGITFAVVGLALFTMHAGYLYAVKFRGRGVALRFLYGRVRHPQYASLIVAGLGFAILWPRFVNLVLFLAMCAAYLALARTEERRMLLSHGDAYRTAMLSKPMFFPGGPGAWMEKRFLYRLPQAARAWMSVALLSAIALTVSFVVREACIGMLRFESVPGAPQAHVVAHGSPPAPALLDAITALAAETPQVPQLFYVAGNWHRTEHLLIDSGVRITHEVRLAGKSATLYIVRSRVLRANGDPVAEAKQAQSLRVRRVVDGVYAVKVVDGRVHLSELTELRSTRYAHSHVPLL